MLGAGHVSAATAPDTTPPKALIPVEAGQLGRANSAPMCRGHAAGAAEAQTPAWATQCYSKHKGCGQTEEGRVHAPHAKLLLLQFALQAGR